jgi:hypothetical protein
MQWLHQKKLTPSQLAPLLLILVKISQTTHSSKTASEKGKHRLQSYASVRNGTQKMLQCQ